MQLAEFIYEQPAVGDIEYIFKHALTQEVAYNSMLIERRKLLHERAGEAMEELYAGSWKNISTNWRIITARSGNVDKARGLSAAWRRPAAAGSEFRGRSSSNAGLTLLKTRLRAPSALGASLKSGSFWWPLAASSGSRGAVEKPRRAIVSCKATL